jgi:hypothetical protein
MIDISVMMCHVGEVLDIGKHTSMYVGAISARAEYPRRIGSCLDFSWIHRKI